MKSVLSLVLIGVDGYKMTPKYVQRMAAQMRDTAEQDCEEFKPTGKFPASVDWAADRDWPVKNQQQCGSCWAFSTAGAIESMDFGKGLNYSISEQQFMDCDRTSLCDQCQGGQPWDAIQHASLENPELLCTEEEYPYVDCQTQAVDKNADSTQVCSEHGRKCSQALDVKCMKVPHNNVDALKEAIAQQPVSVLVYVNESLWYGHAFSNAGDESCDVFAPGSGAIEGVQDWPCINGTDGTEVFQDHAVLAVGYGVDNGVEYFKLRNSWGGEWAEKGYIRLAAHSTQTPQLGSSCMLKPNGQYPSLVFPVKKSAPKPPKFCHGKIPTVNFKCSGSTRCCGSHTLTPSCIDYRYNSCCEHKGIAVACAKGQKCGVLAGSPTCLPFEVAV